MMFDGVEDAGKSDQEESLLMVNRNTSNPLPESSSGIHAVITIVDDEDLSAASPAYSAALVCTRCTFSNQPKSSEQLHLQRTCAMCEHPLQHPWMTNAAVLGNMEASLPPLGQDFPRSLSLPQVDATANMSTAKRVQSKISHCWRCSVTMKAGKSSYCSICIVHLDGSNRIPIICTSCTLINAPKATICNACGVPLSGSDGNQMDLKDELDTLAVKDSMSCSLREGEKDQDALEGVIANLLKTTAEPVSELKARTMEDGGDPNAISLDFIPRLHERLVAQYESHRRKQDHGAQCGATAQRNSLLGFVPESRRKFNGRTCDDDRKSGERHHIKWRLCHPRTIHYTQRGTHGSEFSCGYRNIQILCSALMEWPEYRRVLFGGSGCTPGISLLQAWIERAWADGYDPDGCEQLGGPGALLGSEKWIGATECATLLRSFGIKAEVVDFETEVSFQARSRCRPIASQENAGPSSQEKKRKSLMSPQPSRKVVSNDPVVPERQLSISSFMSQSRPPPEGSMHKLNNRDNDDGDGSVKSRRTQEYRPSARMKIMLGRNDGASRSVDPEIESRYDQPREDRGSSTLGSSPNALARCKNNEEAHGRSVRRGKLRRNRRGSKATGQGSSLDEGCGRSVIQWAWEYFGTPWCSEESAARPYSGQCGYTARKGTTVTYRHEGLSAPRTSQENEVLVNEENEQVGCISAWKPRDRQEAGGITSHAHRDKRKNHCQESKPSDILVPDQILSHHPPPLYLQHDGHSRTVVGVLRPVGEAGPGGGAHKNSKGQQSMLLIFDPSHDGAEISNALSDRYSMKWCSFLKRGAHTLRRRQFQMVAVRPGLIGLGHEDSWKSIVSTKIRVR